MNISALQIPKTDEAAISRARERWASLAKPLGGLGNLEELVVRVSGLTGDHRYNVGKRAVVVFCADNGVVAEGVAQAGADVTRIMAEGFVARNTSVCIMAKCANADVVPVDMGIDTDIPVPGIVDRRIASGTGNIANGPAMTRAQAEQAIQAGIDMVEQLKSEGYRMLATGEMGIGNTSTSSAITSVLLDRDPSEVTGRGAGLSDEGLLHKANIIRQAIQVNRPDPADPIDILAKLGGFDIAAMMGMCIGGALHRVPIVLDGLISTVSALLACRLNPAIKQALIAGHLSSEPAARPIAEELGLFPLVTAGMRLGEGTGAVAAFPLIDMAFAVYYGMPTFADMTIESYKPL